MKKLESTRRRLLPLPFYLLGLLALPQVASAQCSGDNTAPTASAKNVTVELDASGHATILTAAATIFTENFASDANNFYSGGSSITNWNTLNGGIDVGEFVSGISGREIDLSGFTNGGIESKTTFSFSPGTYTLTFDHTRNTYDVGFTVTIGSIVSQSFTSTSSIKSETITFTVTSSTSGKISMVQTGTNDAYGSFIGNIKLAKKSQLSIDNGSTDNCAIGSTSASQTDFDCTDVGNNTVTFTVTDLNGNSSSTTAVVTVKDNIAPSAVAKDVTIQLDANGKATVSASQVNNGSSDNCSYTVGLRRGGAALIDQPIPSSSWTTHNSSVGHGQSFTATTTGYLTSVSLKVYSNVSGTKVHFYSGGTGSGSTGSVGSPLYTQTGVNLTGSTNGSVCSNVTLSTPLYVESGKQYTFIVEGTTDIFYGTDFYSGGVFIWNYYTGSGCCTWGDIAFKAEIGAPLSSLSFDCSNIGANAINLVVIDGSGNVSTDGADITVEDNIAPTVVTKNITLGLDANGEATVTASQLDGGSSDNCGMTLTIDKESFDCDDIGNTTVITRVSDADWKQSTVELTTPSTFVSVANSLPAASTYTVSVQNVYPYNQTLHFTPHVPSTSPIYSRGGTKFFKTNFSLTGQPVSLRIRARVDNYMEIFVNGQSIGLESSLDTKNFTNTAYHDVYVDGNGVQNGYSGGMAFDQVTSQDILSLLHAGNNELVFAIGNTNGTDEGGFEVRLDAEAGGVPVTLTAEDGAGNKSTGTAYVLIEDKVAPVVSTKNITVTLDGNGQATISAADVNDGSADNCSISTLTIDKTSFNCGNLGNNTVKLTATDASGNTSSATATVTVKDNSAPTVVTKNITVNLGSNGTASITAAMVNNGSSDNCGIASLSLDKTDFTCSNTGNNTVTLTATDASGNSSSQTAVVTVKDEIAPTVATKDITVYLDANGSATIGTADVDNGSYDNCSFTLALDKTSFGCSNTGANTVTLKATDASGNTTSQTATVTVKDNTAPTVVTKDITIYLDANGAASIGTADVDNGSYDNCSFSLSLDKTSFGCSNTGANTVTLKATDASGNTTSQTATVTVKDNIAPTVVTKDITIYLDANGSASIGTADVDNGSSDNCSFSLALDNTSFSCSNTGANTVTLKATDASGNTTSQTATVTVKDNIAPTVATQNVTIYLDANGAASITTASVDNGSYDNCSFSLSLDKTSFNCSNVGDNTVTLTATDASGNATSKTAVVTVKDAIAPTVVTQDVTIYLDAAGAASITTSDINNGSSDNCTIASYSLDKTSFDCSNTGANTVTLTVTDVNGNSASATATVTVKDAINPVAKAKNISITLNNSTGSASISTTDVDNGSSDNCSFTLSLDKTSFDCSNVGDNTVTLTATDASGNTHSTTCVVTVKTTLTASAGSDAIVYYGYTPMASATLTASGNGGSGSYTYKWSTGATTKSITVSPTSTTTYTVTVTDGNGCTAKDEVKVTVVDVRCGNKNDKVMVCHNGHTICIDASAVPAHLSNHADDYIGDCGSRSSTGEIVEGDNSNSGDIFGASHAAAQISAYPNPFTTSTTIEFTLGRTQNVSLEVYDVKGVRVATLFQGKAEQGVTNYATLDATKLKADVYFARLITEAEVKVVKLVIVR